MSLNYERSYVLITPAKNEEKYIKKTIDSVVSQTILPMRWVIVSDGSTDGTEEIVIDYCVKHDFMRLLRADDQRTRDFGSKVMAFRAGAESLGHLEYDFIGNLDADVSFDSSYFEHLLKKFHEDKKLGVGGGRVLELKKGVYKAPFGSKGRSVPGAIQLFRRKCYDDIGGYIPLTLGGEDGVAETMARIHNWNVESFKELEVIHHRAMGFGDGCGVLKYRFRGGLRDYSMGYNPIFFLAKAFARIVEEPYIIGTLFRLSGYCWAIVRGFKKEVPCEFIDSIRKEQISRLKTVLHLK
jgi:glycosyltransferase involved in cell wall biosynthesis